MHTQIFLTKMIRPVSHRLSETIYIVRFRTCFLFSLFCLLASCGGGGGSAGGSVNQNNQSASESTTSQVVKNTFVSDYILEPAYSINSYGNKLYAGTEYGIVEINPITGTKRTVAGNELVSGENGERGILSFVQKLVFDPIYAYVSSQTDVASKVSRVALSDTAGAHELIVTQRGMAAIINFRGIAANTNETFWFGYNVSDSSIEIFSQRHGQADTNKKLLTLPGEYINAVAHGDYLYLYIDNRVYRYQISSNNLQLLADHPTRLFQQPLLASQTGVYWAYDGTVYFVSNLDTNVQQKGSVNGKVKKLTLAGTNLYVAHHEDALTVPSGKMLMVSRIDTGTGNQTKLFEQDLDETQRFVISGTNSGKVYWAESRYNSAAGKFVTGLYEILPTGERNLLLQPTPSVLSAPELMYATDDVIVISDGAKMLLYKVQDASATGYYPAVRPNYFHGSGADLFIAGYTTNTGIMRLALNKTLNKPAVLQSANHPTGTSPEVATIKDGYIYWSVTTSGQYHEISRSKSDGSDYLVLQHTIGELKDPIIYGSRLYFLCQNSCGAQGWVIASVPLGGGVRQTEAIVDLENPRLYVFKDKGYATGADGNESAIFSIDFNTWDVSLLTDSLPYTHLALAFSDKWVYWGGEMINSNGSPNRAIARQQWINWNKLDTVQYIENGSGLVSNDIDDLRINTIHSSNGYLYYWKKGLIRVKE